MFEEKIKKSRFGEKLGKIFGGVMGRSQKVGRIEKLAESLGALYSQDARGGNFNQIKENDARKVAQEFNRCVEFAIGNRRIQSDFAVSDFVVSVVMGRILNVKRHDVSEEDLLGFKKFLAHCQQYDEKRLLTKGCDFESIPG